MTKEKYNISFSGGRTSAYMTKLLLDNFSDKYEFHVTFANTGREHPKTLEFVHNCDIHFGFNTVWLEAKVHHNERVGCTHRIVNYETADRNGVVFESVIKKYGIPNQVFQLCNREMKLNVMRSYRKSKGLQNAITAIGIRADEPRRIRENAEQMRIAYPLVDLFPSDKQDVMSFWEDQEFDLGLDDFNGNCIGCFKKSDKKLFMQIRQNPSWFEWHHKMESLYEKVGAQPEIGRRVFFRRYRDTAMLLADCKENADSKSRQLSIDDEDSGCSESCEFLPTDGKI